MSFLIYGPEWATLDLGILPYMHVLHRIRKRLKIDQSDDDVAPIAELDTQEQKPQVESEKISATTPALACWLNLKRTGYITFSLRFKLF